MASPTHPFHPLPVTITAWGVFLFGAANLWLAFGLYSERALLAERGAVVSPMLRAIAALTWAGLFLGLAAATWRRRAWVRRATPAAILFFGAYHLGLTLRWTTTPEARQGWPLTVAFFVAAAIWSAWALNRPASRPFFERHAGHRPVRH